MANIYPQIKWQEPWYQLEEIEHQKGIQKELNAEIGHLHPLWEKSPVAFGKRGDNDDVLVALNDGSFAIVHLVWHGHVDGIPDVFPYTTFFQDLQSLQAEIDAEAIEWTVDV